MSIQTQIDRLRQAKSDLVAQIEAKGISVPSDASLDDLAALVAAISSQEDLSEELTEQDGLIEELRTVLAGKVAGSGEAPVLQSKTVTPSTSEQTVTPDAGYDGLSEVLVEAMPTAEQATPGISVNTATGLITATSNQSAGYVPEGVKKTELQLPVETWTFTMEDGSTEEKTVVTT